MIKDSGPKTPKGWRGRKVSLTVGIHGAEGAAAHGETKGEPLTVAQVGAFHEFGTSRVPQRSFVRGWFDESQAEIAELLRSQLALAAAGKLTVEQALERVALKCEASMKKRIRNRIPPPLAPETIARKGSSVPLIDTGQLRNSIRAKAEIVG